MNIDIKILDARIKEMMPSHATAGSAAVDLRACIEEPITILPGCTVLIPTGFALNIKDSRYAAIILPRSGLGHKEGLILGNSTGLIDSDYQGEIMVSIFNRNPVIPFNEIYHKTINPMDRIAQLMLIPVKQIFFNVVDNFEESTRGSGGFGHSGVK